MEGDTGHPVFQTQFGMYELGQFPKPLVIQWLKLTPFYKWRDPNMADSDCVPVHFMTLGYKVALERCHNYCESNFQMTVESHDAIAMVRDWLKFFAPIF